MHSMRHWTGISKYLVKVAVKFLLLLFKRRWIENAGVW